MRLERTGGGAMICVADHYDCELISSVTVNLPYTESVPVKITHQSKTILVSTINRPSNTSLDLFKSFIENNFPFRENSTSNYIICGDFNLNLLNTHEIQKNASMLYFDMQVKCCYLLYQDRLVKSRHHVPVLIICL